MSEALAATATALEPTVPDEPVFFDPSTLPWTPGPLERTWFKLLNINPESGGSTMLLRVAPESRAAIHKHIGSVEGYIYEGEFAYGDDKGAAHSYLYEENGSIHEPTSGVGFEAFLLSRGATIGFHPNGDPAVSIDAAVYYQLAKANGAANHLKRFDSIYGDARRSLHNPFAHLLSDTGGTGAGQLVASAPSSVKERRPDRRAFTDTNDIPWAPWVMEGTWFKLLHLNNETGGWSMMLKVRPGQKAVIHHHIGSIEGFMVEGEFGYGEADRGAAGAYVYEAAEALHTPNTESGFTMFTVFNGPIAGYDDAGRLSGIVDQDVMLQLARDHNAVQHLMGDSA
ncbi:MAG: cupin domain-containing protein [Pseudomonadota bacterium]